jgi:hypothetical protein
MKKLIYSALFSSLLVNSFAQISDFGLPQTMRGKISKTKVFDEMPAVDAVAQINQDEQNRIDGIDKMYRFGVEHVVNINILSEASKQTLPNGDVVYQYGLFCPNAISINLIFNQFELPAGARLYLVANDGNSYSGAYTSLNNNANKILGTELIYDQKAIIELAKVLEKEVDLEVIVEGHTDTDKLVATVHPKSNWELSVLRATAVVEIMTANTKVNPAILMAAGRSEFHPVDPADKAKNRRIEVIISPNLNALFELINK